LLTEADMANLSFNQLQYAIDEMYARYGTSDPEIERQFGNFPWYKDRHKPDLTLPKVDKSFTPIEQANRDLLARLRNQKRPR
jgi:hypothetical protein